MSWTAVIVTSLGCFAIKAVGYLVPTTAFEHPTVQRIAGLLPVTLLAALAAQQTFTHGHHLQLDARAPAVGVAVAALRVRAPFLVVVMLAAATAGVWRLVAG